MKKRIYLSLIILFFLTSNSIAEIKISISALVNDQIITNLDIKKESEYLKILNPNLEQLNEDQVLELAQTSLVNEIVKKKEIIKFKKLDDLNPFVTDYLKNLLSKLDYTNEEDFEIALKKNNNYSIDEIKNKINIELYWNELIYSKYNQQIKINEKELLKKIDDMDKKTQKDYLLSEIVFTKQKGKSSEEIFKQLKMSIDEIGFDNTANIYSVSESSKLGGKIGWVNESRLSNPIIQKLNLINKGEFTDIIEISNNLIILKINDIKISKIEIDKKKELKKLIEFETNKQLNKFSRIYFNKAKINYSINEK